VGTKWSIFASPTHVSYLETGTVVPEDDPSNKFFGTTPYVKTVTCPFPPTSALNLLTDSFPHYAECFPESKVSVVCVTATPTPVNS